MVVLSVGWSSERLSTAFAVVAVRRWLATVGRLLVVVGSRCAVGSAPSSSAASAASSTASEASASPFEATHFRSLNGSWPMRSPLLEALSSLYLGGCEQVPYFRRHLR